MSLTYTHCKIDGCTNNGYFDKRYNLYRYPNGYCISHYQKVRKYGDPNVIRQSPYLDKDDPCYWKYVWAYRGMKARCYNKNLPCYRHYGGRGIKVSNEWLGIGGIQRFIKDMGPPPSPKHSLDRIDHDGDYGPLNCRWATVHTQNANRRNNRPIVGVSNRGKSWEAYFTAHGHTIRKRFLTLAEAIDFRLYLEAVYKPTNNARP